MEREDIGFHRFSKGHRMSPTEFPLEKTKDSRLLEKHSITEKTRRLTRKESHEQQLIAPIQSLQDPHCAEEFGCHSHMLVGVTFLIQFVCDPHDLNLHSSTKGCMIR